MGYTKLTAEQHEIFMGATLSHVQRLANYIDSVVDIMAIKSPALAGSLLMVQEQYDLDAKQISDKCKFDCEQL